MSTEKNEIDVGGTQEFIPTSATVDEQTKKNSKEGVQTSFSNDIVEELDEEFVKSRILKHIDNILCLDDIQGVVSLHQLGLLPRDELKGYFDKRQGSGHHHGQSYWQYFRKGMNVDEMGDALHATSVRQTGIPLPLPPLPYGTRVHQDKAASIPRAAPFSGKYVDVNARNSDGETALTFALKNEQLEMIKILIERGNANVDDQDDSGFTELMMAARRGQINMVKLLVERYNANLHLRNKDGMTALMIAEKYHRTEVVRYLKTV